MDIGHCSDDLPAHFPVPEPDLTFPRGAVMTYTAGTNKSQVVPSFQDSVSLRDVGSMGCSGSTQHLACCHLVTERSLCHAVPGCAVAVGPEARLYRSLENLHWTAVAEGNAHSFSPPCQDTGREFVFHHRTTSDWYEVSTGRPDINSLLRACISPRSGRPEVGHSPTFAKVPQWLFPSMTEKVLNGDAKRGLKEKLRFQSHKATEVSKPVRPQAFPEDLSASKDCTGRVNYGHCPSRYGKILSNPLARKPSQNGCSAPQQRSQRLSSPAEIKEEAMRRLKLRRQNSTPNLIALPSKEEGGEVVKSQTTEPLAEPGKNMPKELSTAASERRRNFKARVHIPSFEEFKKLRKREKCQAVSTDVQLQESKNFATLCGTVRRTTGGSCPSLTKMDHHNPWKRQLTRCQGFACCDPRPCRCQLEAQQLCSQIGLTPTGNRGPGKASPAPHIQATTSLGEHHASPDPICTSPAPGSPLQTEVTLPRGCEDLVKRPEPTNHAGFSQDVNHVEKNMVGEAQLSCCPSLLLETAADLSGYGVRFQQMKDGLIGSAIDLIKKSCTAEAAAVPSAHLQELGDITVNEQDNQSGPVSTATLDCGAEGNRKLAGVRRQTDCHSLPGCRRSSSDAAYGTTESAKAQRECRLRPHFSDPMPADAVKRKQLEMRIAAAAWGLGQKRRQEKDGNSGNPLSNPSIRLADSSSSSKPRDGHQGRTGSDNRSKHRWSNLSTDSGVVGLNDRSEEREEEEAERERKSRTAEVERADSGIGPAMAKKWKSRVGETARSVQAWVVHRPCVDCGERDISEADLRDAMKIRENLCGQCAKRRTERKEAILEFVNTESSYGEDLRIIKEEFHLPMQAAGLLTPEQLAVIFSNIQELIEVNEKFLERLHDSTEQAFDQDDEDFLTVCIGEMFLEFVNMLPAFQTYCIHQSTSINMLNTLEKEKELLRIFLDVSQNDNTALRRMNLRSFLMAPLQRVTKYPLLLSRISNSTPEYHPDHCSLREAKSRVESHLEHINMKTKQEAAPPWSLRSFRRDSRRNREVVNIEMREIAIKALGWPREDTRFPMEGTLQSSQPSDGQWAKKGSRSLKFQTLHVLLMVNVGREPEPSQDGTVAGSRWDPPVRDAALVLIRDKSGGKFSLFRRPIHLSHCVVSSDPDCDDTFELLDIRKEAFVFRDTDKHRTRHWFRLIKRYSQDLGSWRKRRNALPNIMINATYSRS
ncbi:uncharacterized protein si:dkey-91i10.2 [Chiloscyllium plagiosum]|uniref:uncharacterized protein si:dkey-91i10.2 n=1 Tax=Chiloscyllium plagiosum TaxID=36176 RepID=UPI001CB7D1E9|nr:uncharacterized protein si:dkey-91i10.2 [Chiloscyllium plagiosum]XP_043550185.1 uncharacterized protein si:dkey-91i10.2 [Chiloscyllium plagiosum]XP_043550187.1 uncharacterized protein si:dkey-91i10.2 [Chiloscyllium plagiosum]